MFHVLNTYPGACTLPFLAFVECVGVVWIYGLFRFVEDVEYMLGFKPSVFYQVVWLLIPIYLMVSCSVKLWFCQNILYVLFLF